MSIPETAPTGTAADLRAARRQLLLDTAAIAASVGGFGFVFGLAARNAGYSLIEAQAMSVITFAGASQFAAVGFVTAGLPFAVIAVLTFFLNARHFLYSAALAPRLRTLPFAQRVVMAHVLTDEAFALSAGHFHRIGRVDVPGYWIAAIVGVFIPWNVTTFLGGTLGAVVPDPAMLGLDVVFPAAMGGLGVGLITGRRELVAAAVGAGLAVLLSLLVNPTAGIVAGGVLGPLAGMLAPGRDDPSTGTPGAAGHHPAPDSDMAGTPVDIDEAIAELGDMPPQDGARGR